MTVREAFAAAGFPALDRCKIVYAYDGYVSEHDYLDDTSVEQVVQSITPDWWTVENPPYRNWELFTDDGWSDPGNMMKPCGYGRHPLPDLSNLPAMDCLDSLPKSVRDIVRQTEAQDL